MKHIHKKWLLRTIDYSSYIVILGPITYKFTQLSFLQPFIEISCLAYFVSTITLFCNDCYVNRSFRVAFKKNRFMCIFWVVWIAFVILVAYYK